MTDDEELKTTSVRVNPKKWEELEQLLKKAEVAEIVPWGTNRSKVLRDCIDEKIEQLKEELSEGNLSQPVMIPAK